MRPLARSRVAGRQSVPACPRILSTSLEIYGGIAPSDEIADGIALIKRVEEVADFGGFPNERALNFGNGYLARLASQVSSVSIGCGVTV